MIITIIITPAARGSRKEQAALGGWVPEGAPGWREVLREELIAYKTRFN